MTTEPPISEAFEESPHSRWHPQLPWNLLPKLPPAVDLESKAILKQCIIARAKLAELKQAAELIPDQSLLISTLPLLEAQASSEIENIVTTTDKLFRHPDIDDEAADPATREALRYRRALMEGYQLLKQLPLSTRMAETICSHIKGSPMQVRKVPGTALARGELGGDIIYTPPVGEPLLRELLSNWEKFLNATPDLDPLVRMAVGHYQFEAIHPFTDGNGRTGRVLNSLYLIQENLLTLPILYLSRYIIQHKADYYRLLLSVTQSATWEAWVLFMLRGIEETATWTVDKIAAIRQLHAATIEQVKTQAPKIYSYELVNLIFERPYCRIQDVTQRGLFQRQTASAHLNRLVEIGILESKPLGKEKLFINTPLLNSLAN